jgi:hypothetical protein
LTSFTALAQSSDTLTNTDIINMTRSGLSSSIVVTTIKSATSVNFDLSADSLVALKRAAVSDAAIEAMINKARPKSEIPRVASVNVPEKSDRLAVAKPTETILSNFKTLYIRAGQANFFDDHAVKAAMSTNKDFQALNIVVVDDYAVADVILEVSYTFAFDYPFTLHYQNSSVVLLSGKGTGAFSGPAGATSVVSELTKALKPYRQPTPPAPKVTFTR